MIGIRFARNVRRTTKKRSLAQSTSRVRYVHRSIFETKFDIFNRSIFKTKYDIFIRRETFYPAYLFQATASQVEQLTAPERDDRVNNSQVVFTLFRYRTRN